MKYITEYLTQKNGKAKLKFEPFFIVETNSYALFNDSFELCNDDFSESVTCNGNIVKIDNDYYLSFLVEEDFSDFYNVSVTYGIADEAYLSLEEIKNALGITDPQITDYSALITTFNQINFVDVNISNPIFLPTYISSKVDCLATQYKDSARLKSLLLSHLRGFEEPFLKMNKIKDVLNLERAKGKNLELIGKIVGVNRAYCGDFGSTLNYAIQTRVTSVTAIEEIVLDDECLRKLIKVKILKNSKKTVNYKELSEILSLFFERDVELRSCGEFALYVDVGAIENEYKKCLILLRAFLPLPPTIKLYFVEDITTKLQNSARVSLAGLQSSTLITVNPLQSASLYLNNNLRVSSSGTQITDAVVQTPLLEVILLKNRIRATLNGKQTITIETKE